MTRILFRLVPSLSPALAAGGRIPGRIVGAGTGFCRLEAGGNVQARQVVLLT